jgi:acetyl-CoA C-acetyltransferase
MDRIVIVSAARTAVGKFNGSLKDHEASDLGGIAIKAAIERSGLTPEMVDEAVMGCVGTAAENAFLARLAATKAGMPYSSTAMTVNRLCASGLQAIVTAGMEIDHGFADICVAGGAESMTNMPYMLRKARNGYRMGDGVLEDGLTTALSDPYSGTHMGITAENIAERYHIGREEQDVYAAMSQKRAKAAIEKGLFQEEIVPVTIAVNRKETRTFDVDEFPRFDTTAEGLANLRPAFKPDGTVTAGNASGVNDGAAAVVLMKESKARELKCRPMAYLHSSAVAGVDPDVMGTGPIPAVRKLLKKTGLTLDDIGLVELNEAFAVQTLACIRELGLDIERTNVNGSGIAMGHPIGATGCIITVKLINEMIRRKVKYGIATLCIGGGQGLAVLFELCG